MAQAASGAAADRWGCYTNGHGDRNGHAHLDCYADADSDAHCNADRDLHAGELLYRPELRRGL